MGFYHKNIGGVHQAVRIVLGLAVIVAALVFLSGLAQWLLAASGLAFALTGCIGYCPMCAIAGVDGSHRS